MVTLDFIRFINYKYLLIILIYHDIIRAISADNVGREGHLKRSLLQKDGEGLEMFEKNLFSRVDGDNVRIPQLTVTPRDSGEGKMVEVHEQKSNDERDEVSVNKYEWRQKKKDKIFSVIHIKKGKLEETKFRKTREVRFPNRPGVITDERTKINANLSVQSERRLVNMSDGSVIETLSGRLNFNWTVFVSALEKSMSNPRRRKAIGKSLNFTVDLKPYHTCKYNDSYPPCEIADKHEYWPITVNTTQARIWESPIPRNLIYNTLYEIEVEYEDSTESIRLVSEVAELVTPGCMNVVDLKYYLKCNKTAEANTNTSIKKESHSVNITCASFDETSHTVLMDLDWTLPNIHQKSKPQDEWNSLISYSCPSGPLICLQPKILRGTKTRIDLPADSVILVKIHSSKDSNSIIYYDLTVDTSHDRISGAYPACSISSGAISAPSTSQVEETTTNHGLMITLFVLTGFGLVALAVFLELRNNWVRHNFCMTVSTTRCRAAEVGKSNSYLPSPSGGRLVLHGDLPLLDSSLNVDDWEVDASEVTLGVELGQGAFGRVLTGYYHNQKIAIKILKDFIPELYREDLLREIALMKLLGGHPNIVSMIGACTIREPIALLMEYMPYGNLQCFLKKCRTDRELHGGPDKDDLQYCLLDEMTGQKEFWKITSNDVLSFARQIALAMEYLADRKLVHRDLAARNVLLGSGKVVKVADFGLARMVSSLDMNQYCKRTSGRLPLKWMALESIRDRVFTVQSDVWSFGILLWEIVTLGASPYPTIALVDIYRLLSEGYRMQQPKHCCDDLYDIMSQCWCENPSDRPNFTTILAHLEQLLSRNTDYLDLDNIDAPLNHSQLDGSPSSLCPGGRESTLITADSDLELSSPPFLDDDSLQLHLDFC